MSLGKEVGVRDSVCALPREPPQGWDSRYYSLGCVTLCLALLLSQTGDPAPWGTLPGPPKRLYRWRERRRCLELARWPERFVNPWSVCDQSWKLSLTKCQMTLAGRLVISDQALAGLYLITANWVIFYPSSLLKSLSQTLPFELVSWRRPQLLLSLSSCECTPPTMEIQVIPSVCGEVKVYSGTLGYKSLPTDLNWFPLTL